MDGVDWAGVLIGGDEETAVVEDRFVVTLDILVVATTAGGFLSDVGDVFTGSSGLLCSVFGLESARNKKCKTKLTIREMCKFNF